MQIKTAALLIYLELGYCTSEIIDNKSSGS